MSGITVSVYRAPDALMIALRSLYAFLGQWTLLSRTMKRSQLHSQTIDAMLYV